MIVTENDVVFANDVVYRVEVVLSLFEDVLFRSGEDS